MGIPIAQNLGFNTSTTVFSMMENHSIRSINAETVPLVEYWTFDVVSRLF
jgi:hypothetical protein